MELLVYIGFWVLWAVALFAITYFAFWFGNKF